MPKKLQPKKLGTCYIDVFNFFCYECDLNDVVMVHGILHGVGELEGWIYGHAWIELGDVVLQPIVQEDGITHNLAFVSRKEIFYKKYNVSEITLRRYNKELALELGIRYRHFGPWHDLGLGDKGYMYKG